MNLTNKIFFFILFILKEFTSTLTSDSGPEQEYDITKPLNEAIGKLFQCASPSSAVRLVSHMKNNGKSVYEFLNTRRLTPFGTKIYLRNVNISVWEPESTPKIICKFEKNKMSIFNEDLVFNVVGVIDSAKKPTTASTTCATFKTMVKFRNISVTASETINGPYNKKFEFVFVYNQLVYNQLTLPWVMAKKLYYGKKQELLINKIKSVIPQLIHQDLNHNEKFLHLVHSSYCHRPMQKLAAAYPNLLVDEDRHIYFIPKVTFLGIDLLNVKIKGLTNFESLKPNATFGKSAYTLTVKKVRGSMNLENKEFQNFKFYEMVFNIDYLLISVDFESRRLVVEARDYAVMQTSTNPPRVSVFSTVIMQSIESAIGSLIMPVLQGLESSELDQEPFCNQPASSPEEIVPEMPSESSLDTRTTETSTTTPSETEPEKATTKPRTSENPTSPKTPARTSRKTEATSKSTKSPWSNAAPLRIITISALKARSKVIKSQKIVTTQSSNIEEEASSSEGTYKDASENTDTNICNLIAEKDTDTVTKPTKDDEKDKYEYGISFHNVTIKLMPGTPYPSRIQCGLFKNFKIDYEIDAIPTGNIRLGNKGNAININFHANFTSVEIAVEKFANGSKENETCQFQIYNNQDIQVVLPSTNSTGLSGNLKMRKEIDETMLSMVKERISQTVKPIVCLPLNFCTHSVRMLDDFFQCFVDRALKKCSLCSLRRNTTITA